MKLSEIRDNVVEALRKEEFFKGMTVAVTDGFHFSAADIAVPDKSGKTVLYRIAVVKQGS